MSVMTASIRDTVVSVKMDSMREAMVAIRTSMRRIWKRFSFQFVCYIHVNNVWFSFV